MKDVTPPMVMPSSDSLSDTLSVSPGVVSAADAAGTADTRA
jgi:hypothetical protein